MNSCTQTEHYFPAPLVHLSCNTLSLELNWIKHIRQSAFIHLNNLKKLILSENRISQFFQRWTGLANLQLLDLSENKVNYTDNTKFFTLRNLKQLYLNENKGLILCKDSFIRLNSLQVLNLDYNKMVIQDETILMHNKNLTHLHLR